MASLVQRRYTYLDSQGPGAHDGYVAAQRWESMTPRERWELSSTDEMLAMSLHRERGAMVIDDLRALPASPLNVAEGSTLPASAITRGIAARSRAVWLIPSAAFQRSQLAASETTVGRAQLYLLLGEIIEREAREHGARTLAVDGSQGIAATADAVEPLFGDALEAGPRAQTLEERKILLQEANEAITAQVRGYYARPWAQGDPDSVIREFGCECRNLACDAGVRLKVGELGERPALAPGHGLEG
jgi:hypothetical protein